MDRPSAIEIKHAMMPRQSHSNVCHRSFDGGSVLPIIKMDRSLNAKMLKSISSLDGLTACVEDKNRTRPIIMLRVANLDGIRILCPGYQEHQPVMVGEASRGGVGEELAAIRAHSRSPFSISS